VIDVVVVGGGIAGLTAAYALAGRGRSFRLLEASGRLGGVIVSEREAGFLLEGGPDSLLAQKPAGMALCRELGLGERLIPTNQEERTVFVLHRGRLHALPEGMVLAVPTRVWPFLRSGLFSWAGKVRMGLELVQPRRREGGDESIAAFTRRRFGKEALERLAEPLLAGIHAGDAERLSMAACLPRFVDMEARTGSLIRGLWAAPRAGGAAFWSLSGGLGELTDALVSRLPGASINKDARVLGIEPMRGGFRVRTAAEAVESRTVVIALPPHAAAPLASAVAPRVSESLRELRAVDTAVVLLGYRREDVRHPLDGYGLIVPRGEGRRITAAGFFSTKFPGRAPAGHVLLRGFLGGARDPRILESTDAEMMATVIGDLRDVLGLRGDPVLARVFRWPQGTPQLELGHGERLRMLEESLAETPGFFLTGAGLRGTGVPDTIGDATRTAAEVEAFLGRPTAAILDP
jgi:oxygen-dependent protoporphyrinogen oxidase